MDSSIVRIIDANLNRSREALRVIEEYARFVRDDADAARRVKRARHGLRSITDAIGADELLVARDITNDVGRDAKTAAERTRETTEDVVRASFGRLSEAARVLGEYAKLVSPEAADAAEKLRYAAYELEQRIVLRGGLRERFRKVRLYVLITEDLCSGDWLQTTEAAIRGGAGCVQLREKGVADAVLLDRARLLRALTVELNALLIINDRPDIARLSGADGVHVGQEDLSVAEARRIAGGGVLVGKSTHTIEQFDLAVAEHPDYIAVGPMFDSPTKPQNHIAGPETLREAAKRTEIALVGIGGITADNAGGVIEAGAGCVCVCSAVVGADDVEGACRSIAQAVAEP